MVCLNVYIFKQRKMKKNKYFVLMKLELNGMDSFLTKMYDVGLCIKSET